VAGSSGDKLRYTSQSSYEYNNKSVAARYRHTRSKPYLRNQDDTTESREDTGALSVEKYRLRVLTTKQ
jgi:hypothetical protein